jgi:hypothetical protein
MTYAIVRVAFATDLGKKVGNAREIIAKVQSKWPVGVIILGPEHSGWHGRSGAAA